jgi:hypothetical protein
VNGHVHPLDEIPEGIGAADIEIRIFIGRQPFPDPFYGFQKFGRLDAVRFSGINNHAESPTTSEFLADMERVLSNRIVLFEIVQELRINLKFRCAQEGNKDNNARHGVYFAVMNNGALAASLSMASMTVVFFCLFFAISSFGYRWGKMARAAGIRVTEIKP